MENAIDAIKIAFGILVFTIALTLAISVVGQAKATSDVIFHVNDKTEFYEYVTPENIENAEDRIVGIETIIPTIHRYAKEQFAVTIFDKEGNPIVRYDLWTEGFMSDWNQILKKRANGDATAENAYKEVEDRLSRVQDTVNKTIGTNKKFNMDKIGELYKIVNPYNLSVTVGAPWIGDNDQIIERIRCDMIGGTYVNTKITSGSVAGIRYKGKYLKQYKDNEFIEKFTEISTSGKTITDEEFSLETIKGNKKLEIIYIMQ